MFVKATGPVVGGGGQARPFGPLATRIMLCFFLLAAVSMIVQVIRSNNFAVSPVLLTLPTLDGFDVRFKVP